MLHSTPDTGCCWHGNEPQNYAEGWEFVCRRRTVSFPKTLSSEWSWLVVWLIGWLVDWLVVWLIGWLVGCLVT